MPTFSLPTMTLSFADSVLNNIPVTPTHLFHHQFLQLHSSIPNPDINLNDLLFFYSKDSSLDVVQFLLSKGADLHADNDFLFRAACSHNRFDIVYFCIQNGTDPTTHDNNALVRACINGDLKIVQYLTEKGATHKFALYYAKTNNHIQVAQFLEFNDFTLNFY